MIPSSLTNLNNLFLELPSWANGVTVPISTKPKPNDENWLIYFAFLSNPAANPTGLGNLIPNKLVSNFGWFTLKKVLIKGNKKGILSSNFKIKKVKSI